MLLLQARRIVRTFKKTSYVWNLQQSKPRVLEIYGYDQCNENANHSYSCDARWHNTKFSASGKDEVWPCDHMAHRLPVIASLDWAIDLLTKARKRCSPVRGAILKHKDASWSRYNNEMAAANTWRRLSSSHYRLFGQSKEGWEQYRCSALGHVSPYNWKRRSKNSLWRIRVRYHVQCG